MTNDVAPLGERSINYVNQLEQHQINWASSHFGNFFSASLTICGLFYEHFTCVNDDVGLMLQMEQRILDTNAEKQQF